MIENYLLQVVCSCDVIADNIVVALRHQIPQRVGSSKCSHCVLLKLAVLGPSFERDQHLDRTIFWYAAP